MMMMMRNDRRRRRPVKLLLLAGLIAAAIVYLRCGEGIGFGPGGDDGTDQRGDQSARNSSNAAQEPLVGGAAGDTGKAAGGAGGRCRLRLDAQGLTLDGKPVEIKAAVKACAAAGGAELTATGDAVFGDLETLRLSLDQAGVPVFLHQPRSGETGGGTGTAGGGGAAGGGAKGASGGGAEGASGGSP